jgi:protein phosphatase
MFGWFKKRARAKAASFEDHIERQSENGLSPVRVETFSESEVNTFGCVIGLRSDVGCVREGNEDNACAIVPEENDARIKRGVLAVVADGMGGHAGGEIASAMAVETICEKYYNASGDFSVASALRAALETANREIYKASRSDKGKRGMGTTCTTLALRGDKIYMAHAGDSRLYLLRGGMLYQLSEDHSAVMELVRQGVLTAAQARVHENKNLITRALGLHPQVEVDVWDEPMPAQAGDRYLLCSDGLSDLVEDETIEQIAGQGEPQAVCEKLVEIAKARGGHDNITVLILEVSASARGKMEEIKNDDLPVTREVEMRN